jgi:hypothetical protein
LKPADLDIEIIFNGERDSVIERKIDGAIMDESASAILRSCVLAEDAAMAYQCKD